MSPHANRGAAKLASNPKPEEIALLRELWDLTIDQAADLALSTKQNWTHWESGSRRMHPAIWRWVLVQLDTLHMESSVNLARDQAQRALDRVNAQLKSEFGPMQDRDR